MSHKLPPQVLDAFDALASAQRGRPEREMLRAQYALGGGVYSYAIEHAGDLTHRGWSEWHLRGDAGTSRELVDEKVQKLLRTLQHPYGFMREHRENMVANSSDPGRVDRRLLDYARAHMKLPAYNIAQFVARDVAIALGAQRPDKAEEALTYLDKMLNGGYGDGWETYAKHYWLRSDGEPKLMRNVQPWWPI